MRAFECFLARHLNVVEDSLFTFFEVSTLIRDSFVQFGYVTLKHAGTRFAPVLGPCLADCLSVSTRVTLRSAASSFDRDTLGSYLYALG